MQVLITTDAKATKIHMQYQPQCYAPLTITSMLPPAYTLPDESSRTLTYRLPAKETTKTTLKDLAEIADQASPDSDLKQTRTATWIRTMQTFTPPSAEYQLESTSHMSESSGSDFWKPDVPQKNRQTKRSINNTKTKKRGSSIGSKTRSSKKRTPKSSRHRENQSDN